MLKVISLKGGLGNQMFQYAFFLALKQKHPLSLFFFNTEESIYHHGNYHLDEICHTSIKKKAKWFRRIVKHSPKILSHTIIINQKNSLEYDPSYLNCNTFFSFYDGYWQSEKYFKNVSNQVKRSLKFKECRLNNKTKELANRIQKGCFVSVHIRRGDYLNFQDRFGNCSLEYYNKAISYIKQIEENPFFIFFSDDIVWVKENLPMDNSIYVDWNNEVDGWQDMYLMSKCKHNIIANSSFSWWGAWLNENKGKTIIAPKRWFLYTQNYDIIPAGWITI